MKITTDEKLRAIIDTSENGNTTDASDAIKKLSKLNLLRLITLWGSVNSDYVQVIARVYFLLDMNK